MQQQIHYEKVALVVEIVVAAFPFVQLVVVAIVESNCRLDRVIISHKAIQQKQRQRQPSCQPTLIIKPAKCKVVLHLIR